jgi:hypothetical protein
MAKSRRMRWAWYAALMGEKIIGGKARWKQNTSKVMM